MARPSTFVGLSFVLAGALACGASMTAVRETTYAPSFAYIERDKLQSAMWRMADDVAVLDTLVRGVAADQVQQEEVVRVLADIEEAASTLRTSEQSTNHPMLDKHLDDFLKEVASARNAAAASPPSYFLAGSVTGACVHCHSGRGPRP